MVDPSFGERLAVELQEQPEVDRLYGLTGHQVEHRAPALEGQQRAGRHELYLALRGADHGADFVAGDQHRQITADEIDHEAPGELTALLTDDSADAVAGRLDVSESGCEGILAAPVQAVAVAVVAAWNDFLGRIPERHDVVHRLIDGGDFHQHDRALAPGALRGDPATRPPVVPDPVVLVVGEVMVALHQAETARIVVEVGIDLKMRRVGKRPPDPLSDAGVHLQAVRVVDLRAPVVGHAVVVLPDQIHAGARRDAQPLDPTARVEREVHVHHQGARHIDDETISAGDARGVEQGIHGEQRRFGCGLLQVEGDEVREFLRPGHACVDRQSTL